ncbi:MAG: response regulator transcription factor [Chloroflexi bacterium]|nr:response regulator transcription factor [Chloroflexota bacterium]
MTKILIVDDDLALADVLAFTLRRSGFEVVLAHDGREALEQYDREHPDLIVLDWTLPHMDGLSVCSKVRAESNVPIVMLTVRYSDDDVVAALEAGADEYITKPFSPRQLVARLQAVLRRAIGEPQEILSAGALTLDVERRQANWKGGSPIHLTPLETRLLQALLQNVGHVLSVESLIVCVWGPEGATSDMLKQLIYRLRRKIEPDPAAPTLINTIPFAGYVLNLPADSP